MGAVYALALALGTGLTFGGIVGVAMEIATGMRLRFSAPFVTSQRISRSLIASAVAGPFMLANEAIDARRSRTIGAVFFSTALTLSLVWALAVGVLVIEVAVGITGR